MKRTVGGRAEDGQLFSVFSGLPFSKTPDTSPDRPGSRHRTQNPVLPEPRTQNPDVDTASETTTARVALEDTVRVLEDRLSASVCHL